MVVLHDLIHSSRVHQDFVGGVQVSFLLASRSANNSSFSSEVEFCISSFFSDIQIRSILPSKFFSFYVILPEALHVHLVKCHSIL